MNKFDGRTFTPYRHDPEEPERVFPGRSGLKFQTQRNLWVGSKGAVLELFDRKEQVFSTIGHPIPFIQGYFFVTEDQTGNLGIGTAYGLDK